MNEWIYSTDNFSNQAVVDLNIPPSLPHTLNAEKWPPKTDIHVPSDFCHCLQTNRKHMEKQSLICTWKTLFYTDNITSTLTTVVFSINCMYIGCVANLNWKLWTTEKRQHRFRFTGNIACVLIHAFALHSDTRFFGSKVLHEIWRIFPRSFDILVISDISTRYLIFCTKQTRKQSLFYRQHPERHVTFPECLHFRGCMVYLCSETPKDVL